MLEKEKIRRAQKEENIKIMLDYISKYILNKDIELQKNILEYYEQKKAYTPSSYDINIEKSIDHIKSSLLNIQSSNKSGLSSYEIDEIIETKKQYEARLFFLYDLEKMYKIFKKKNIETNYMEILSIFKDVIDNNLSKMYDDFLLPFYKRISNRIGNDISKENVIRELMKSPIYSENKNSEDLNLILITKLLDKFNLKCEPKDLKQLIKNIIEEIELETFENDLDYPELSKNIDIGDYTKHNGYEFEDYLKDLFTCIGYTVLQTPLSGDQGADLIMSKDGEKTVLQAKKYNGAVSNKAVQEIVAAKSHYNASKAIVVTSSTFTKSAIDLALSNGVELWDGQKLNDIIKSLKTNNKQQNLHLGHLR